MRNYAKRKKKKIKISTHSYITVLSDRTPYKFNHLFSVAIVAGLDSFLDKVDYSVDVDALRKQNRHMTIQNGLTGDV